MRVPAEPGPDADLELLVSLLEPGLGAAAARNLGRSALASAGSLHALMNAALHGRGHIQPPCATLLRTAHRIVGRYLYEPLERGRALTSPAETVEYLKHALGSRRREVFLCLFLDTRHRVIHDETLFEGSIDGACVYPRVVAERALRHNAAAIIVAHNHPSGVSEPSLADQAITRRLKDALSLFEIRLLDHFVIGDGEPVSMAARGMI